MYSFTKYRFFRLFHALRKAISLCLLPLLLYCSCTVWLDSLSTPHFLGNVCGCERVCGCVCECCSRVCISEFHISILKWFHTSNKRPWLIHTYTFGVSHKSKQFSKFERRTTFDSTSMQTRCFPFLAHYLEFFLSWKRNRGFPGWNGRFMWFELKLTMPMICVVQRISKRKTCRT